MTRKEVPPGTSFKLDVFIKFTIQHTKFENLCVIFVAKFVFLCYNKCEHIKNKTVCEF